MNPQSNDQQTGSGLHVRIIDGRKIVFDGEDFLNDFFDWSESLFEILASECGLTRITDQHWQVVRFMREFYAYHGRAPLNRRLRKGTGLSVMQIEKLFPGGVKHGARRLSGLPNPKTCN